jgi:hypothetical protein
MENNSQMLLASVIINVLLILERMFNKIKKSECCGSKLELITTNSPTKSNSEREIKNLSDIKVENVSTDESK